MVTKRLLMPCLLVAHRLREWSETPARAQKLRT
jgi:hypothetical protein